MTTPLTHRRVERFSSLLEDAHVSRWWFAVSAVTLSVLLVAIIWYTHLPSYLATYPIRWWFFLAAVLVSPLQFAGYAIALRSASTTKLHLLPVFGLEVGESVTQMATPESVGSFALSMRFLKKAGLDLPSSAAVVGLSSFVSTVTSAIVLPVAVLLAASTINYAELKRDIPSGLWEVIAGVIGGAVFVTVLIKAPKVRFRLAHSARSAGAYVRTAVRNPQRAIYIAFGEFVTLFGETAALMLLVLAVRQHSNVAALVVIVLVASTASSVVPIPGGLGAPEAILVAGLVSLGVEHKAALIAAVSYRLLTYWMPPVPGIISLRWLDRSGRL